MADLPLTGGCGCGAVRFELSETPRSAAWCHCSRCRRRTGAGPSLNAAIAPASFRLLQGEDHLTAWRPEGGFAKWFCRECGSHLWSSPPDDDAPAGIRFGAFDGDPGVRPGHHQFVADAAVWEELPDDGLPRYEGRSPR
jgi:hypothetical protein